MATDFATLLMKVDATGMLPGEQALDRLAAKGEVTEAKVKRATDGMSRSMGNVGKGARQLGPALQNASYQVGDFAVQVASGQSAAIAFAQQFPQLAGGLGIWGAALGAAVAVGAAAVPMLFDVGRGAQDADKALERFTETIDLYQKHAGMATESTEKLLERFGVFGLRVREISAYMAEVTLGEMKDGLEENVEPIKGALSEVQSSMAMLIQHREMLEKMGITEAIGGPLWEQAKVSIDAYQAAVERAATSMGLMPDQAVQLAEALDKLKSAKSIDDIKNAASDALQSMQDFKANGMELPGPLRAAAQALQDISIRAGQAAETARGIPEALGEATGETWNWASAMAGVRAELDGILNSLNALGGGALSNAGKAAELQALQAGRTIAQAARARKELEMGVNFQARGQDLDRREAGAKSWVERLMIQGQRAALGAEQSMATRGLDLDDQLAVARAEAAKRERAASKAGGGGRGSRRDQEAYGKSVQEIMQETEAFLAQADAMARVATAGGDWERALAVIAKEQELLNAAQRSGIEMTPEVVGGIREMAEAYVEAEDRLQRMRDATERGQDAFKDFVGSVLDGAEGMKKALASLLQEMAKVQLQNAAMKAMGAAGGGGFLGAIGTLLTPWGGGRATGGPVQAGTTYLVGEQGPEYVTMGANGYVTPNHALGGASSVSIHIDARGAVEGTAALIEQKIRAAIPQIVNQSVQGVRAQTARGG